MEIIKITEKDGKQLVSAKDLYRFLSIQTDFSDWCKRMFDYGFEENTDFNLLIFEEVRIEGARRVKRQVNDYALTIECAKEISMLQRNEKGKQARQYFIECEKKLKYNIGNEIQGNRQAVIAQAIMFLQEDLENARKQVHQLESYISEIEDARKEATPRLQLNRLVRDYATKYVAGIKKFSDAWNMLYADYKYIHNMDLKIRAENRNFKSPLDYVESECPDALDLLINIMENKFINKSKAA